MFNNSDNSMRAYCECCGDWLPERIAIINSNATLNERLNQGVRNRVRNNRYGGLTTGSTGSTGYYNPTTGTGGVQSPSIPGVGRGTGRAGLFGSIGGSTGGIGSGIGGGLNSINLITELLRYGLPSLSSYRVNNNNSNGSNDNGYNIMMDIFNGIQEVDLTNLTDFLSTNVTVKLTEDQFNRIPDKRPENTDECSICQSSYDSNVINIKEVQCCKKTFHYECLHNWLCERSVSCPTCRADQRAYISTE